MLTKCFHGTQAVVLAAGKGTRLRPLTDDKPKVLVEVNGTPLVEDVFDNLIDAGATELIVVVGYKVEQIIDRYGDAYRDVPITYTHQREQLGLAHHPSGGTARRWRLHADARRQRLPWEPSRHHQPPAGGTRRRRVPRQEMPTSS